MKSVKSIQKSEIHTYYNKIISSNKNSIFSLLTNQTTSNDPYSVQSRKPCNITNHLHSLANIPEDKVLFQNDDVCIVSPNTPGSVLIIHHCPPEVFDKIIDEGVKSRGQLFEDGAVPVLFDHLSDYNENVFFRCFRSVMTINSPEFLEVYQNHPSEWIAISVDPTKTFAYDSTERINHNQFEYNASRISLSSLMGNKPSTSSEVLVRLPIVKPEWFSLDSKTFKQTQTHPQPAIPL